MEKCNDKLCHNHDYNVQTTNNTKSVSFSEETETCIIENKDDLWLYRCLLWYNKPELKMIQHTLYMEATTIKSVRCGWLDHKCLKQAALGKTTELSIIQPLVREIINSIFEKTDLEM